MSPEEAGISPAVVGKITDIKNVDTRIDSLSKNIVTTDPIQQYLQSEEYITSTLEILASKIISEVVENKNVQKLVDNLHSNLAQNTKLEPSRADKLELNVAKAEAALKGFVLPLNDGGPFGELSFMGIEDKEEIFANPIRATKEALIDLSGKAIPKEQYAKAVKDKAIEILKKDPNITSEQLEKYENFITQGDQSQKFDEDKKQFVLRVNKLSPLEFKELQKAATDTVQQINHRLEKNNEIGKRIEQINALTSSLDIKKPEAVMQELNKLDSTYLAENNNKIADELQEISNKGTSLWERIKSVFTGKDYLQERLEQSVNKFNIASDEYVKKEIDNKISSNALTNPQLNQGLKSFIAENKITNIDLNNIDPNKVNLVELRKVNPRSFDKTMFGSSHKQESIQPPTKTPNSPLKKQEVTRV
ncbi:MAG TPA: hypothetical protein LFW21_00205 [Rickettsia endosymbiont of Pyrocoelia pectoralis]|nr:hypothetical protein [Rickettsia endosymbiont of Pyrocoelia pectoralis]